MNQINLFDLPDEILLKILSNLDFVNIIKCGQVCKRIRAISHDTRLLQTINLSGKIVPAKFLQFILENGCKYLSLRNSKIDGDIAYIKTSKLQYLECTNCFAKPKNFERILASSNSLQKLSMASPNTARIMGVGIEWNEDIKSNMIKNFSCSLQVGFLQVRLSHNIDVESCNFYHGF